MSFAPQAPPAEGLAAVGTDRLRSAFSACSLQASRELGTLHLEVGLHVLREDVPEVLGRAAGRELEAAEMAALVKTFVLDTSAAISWREFERSWAALQALLTTPAVPARAAARGKHAVLAAATAAAAHQAARSIEPRTGAAEIGFAHAGAPLPAKQRNESISDRYVPLKTSDVTREGNRYFGMYL